MMFALKNPTWTDREQSSDGKRGISLELAQTVGGSAAVFQCVMARNKTVKLRDSNPTMIPIVACSETF